LGERCARQQLEDQFSGGQIVTENGGKARSRCHAGDQAEDGRHPLERARGGARRGDLDVRAAAGAAGDAHDGPLPRAVRNNGCVDA